MKLTIFIVMILTLSGVMCDPRTLSDSPDSSWEFMYFPSPDPDNDGATCELTTELTSFEISNFVRGMACFWADYQAEIRDGDTFSGFAAYYIDTTDDDISSYDYEARIANVDFTYSGGAYIYEYAGQTVVSVDEIECDIPGTCTAYFNLISIYAVPLQFDSLVEEIDIHCFFTRDPAHNDDTWIFGSLDLEAVPTMTKRVFSFGTPVDPTDEVETETEGTETGGESENLSAKLSILVPIAAALNMMFS